jgi:hypothetical protein
MILYPLITTIRGSVMSRKDRKNLEKLYNNLYIVKYFGKPESCVYCGADRNCLDHVPPLSVVDKIGTKFIRENDIELIKVPCCNKCNTVLGAKMLGTLSERIRYLYDYYLNKFEKEVLWDKEEIEELEGNLKQMVRSRQIKLRREVMDRIRGLEESLLNNNKMNN